MERFIKYILGLGAAGLVVAVALSGSGNVDNTAGSRGYHSAVLPPDTNPDDTILPFPFQDNTGDPYSPQQNGGLYLNNPSNLNSTYEYDPETNTYVLTTKVGNNEVRPSTTMTYEEYQKYSMDQMMQKYWREKTKANRLTKGDGGFIPKIRIGGEAFDRIFGSNTIDIRPSGSAELIFGVISTRTDNPALDVKQRRNTNFNFEEKIQMNVTAKIGDKIQFGVNYNTEASFDFENKMNLKYEGKEDEIIQLIEAGDVTLPLNSSLITGSQALFGIKAKLKFGRTTVTGIFSQQKSKTENITVSGGAQTSQFSVKADQYEENKHFFLGHYYRGNYTKALKKLPTVTTPINITKIEVWVTNVGAATTENRNIIAFQDLSETSRIYNSQVYAYPGKTYPDNASNNLLSLLDTASLRNLNGVNNYLQAQNFVSGVDYEKVELARKLQPSEYTFNSKLGFISLNTTLNSDQTLAVAYQYTLIGDTAVHQVGEFSNGGISAPNCLIVKLLKSSSLNTKIPIWDLMMKNVYSIGGYQVNSQDFRLNVLFSGEENGVPMGFITEGEIDGIPLIKVLGCDRLNSNNDPVPDGVFDFIDMAATQGGTIQASNGRIFFPVLEPFGSDMRKAITGGDPALKPIADKYCYDSLYTMTKTGAQQYPERNKFSIDGMFKSASGSEISLGAMNVPQGSVKVTAGGIPLAENVDYTVDYTLGRVKIINEGILNSGTPINISLESNSMFDIQTKTLMGAHVDYMVNKKFNLGATVLNLTEKPLTQKVNFGDEPISNTIWGVNGNYKTESRLITKIVDFIPLLNTKTVSNVTIDAEFADLIPGHSKAIGKTGTSYIDDFEGSKSTIDLKNIGSWFIASTPQGQPDLFPEASPNSGKGFNMNRAKLAWYVIDPTIFYRNNNQTPPNITNDDISNHYTREVLEEEVFPNKQLANGQPSNIAVLNLAYYPYEKGPYNYDVDGSEGYSDGIDASGKLKNPYTRWAGIQRKIETSDFEATNVEYIEFWMMDPFIYNTNSTGGQLYFDLGDISEDVLRDSRKSLENGLPATSELINVDTTIWGIVPTQQPLTNSFDNSEEARKYQDVGLDGLGDERERQFFDANYLQRIAGIFGSSSPAYAKASADPSSDDFHYFRGPDYDNESKSILDRYKNYNGAEGNSPTDAQTQAQYNVSYPMSATTMPDGEDINHDNTLNESERYFQYRIDLQPSKMNIGQNYIADKIDASTGRLPNGSSATVTWYQFKIPVQNPDRIVNGIQDFKSIRFIRMYLKGFTDSIICRLATLDIVRGEWRRYRYSLLAPGEYIPTDDQSTTTFDVSAVNIEENGQRIPVPYVVPPGIEREINLASTNLQQLNEQSLDMKVCGLMDGDARAVYKTCDFDVRQFKKIRMYAHCEASNNTLPVKDGDLTLFVRLGSDFTSNYYEYELPLKVTDWGTSAENPDAIWPSENQMEITLADLVAAKTQRNTDIRQPGSSLSYSVPYVAYDSKNNKITIVGNPNLSAVKTIMIGVRNPKKKNGSSDDGMDKCAEIWVNELRLTDFDEKGGWAATGRIGTTLADFGTLSIAGTISTPGFGSIDKKVNERQKETKVSYDIATNLELGKFFPEKWGMKIPLHYDYSEMINTPQYNPLNPDVLYKDELSTYPSAAEKDSIRKLTQDYTRRQSLNFMNVRKVKTGGSKSHIYDIENFDVSYAYTELMHRNVDVEYDTKKTHRGGLGYNFSSNAKPVKPFDKVKFLGKSKWFRLIKDFNFFYAPKMLTFRTDIDRQFSENLLRAKTNAIVILEPTYIKSFNWTRDYGLKWDLTQGLKLDYQAHVIAQIDEPPGKIAKNLPDYKTKRDSVWSNVLDLGRIKSFTQSVEVNYTLPINKIPILNWINVNAKYGGDYQWTALPLAADTNGLIIENPLGNTIENSNTKQVNASANLLNLYNKIPYLAKINEKKKGGANKPKTNMRAAEGDTVEEKINYVKEVIDGTLGILMGIKTVNISYQEGNGKLLPGFMPKPVALGMDWNKMAPGLDFVFGNPSEMFSQGSGTQIVDQAYSNNWITSDTTLNTPYIIKQTKNLNGQVSIEPLAALRIDVTATSNYSKQYGAYYRYETGTEFNHSKAFTPMESGSFTSTYITWSTAFINDNKDHSNKTFEKFKEYRLLIAARLAANNRFSSKALSDSTGFPDGYGPTSQDVLIPAFLAAYTGRNPDKISLKPFNEKLLAAIPLPNWRITYTGLTRINWLKKFFKNISVSHTYRSTYSVGQFASNLLYKDDAQDGYTYVRDAVKNFASKYEIGQVSINEQFSPLIGFDMTMVNSLLFKFEIKKSRNLVLSFANNQLTEVTSDEYVIGAGYRLKDVSFNINFSGKKRPIKSDLNLKADFSIRTNKTVLRKLVENMDQVSAGQKVMSINVSADYQISEKFNIRLFFDKIINNPFVSSQYPNSNTNAGLSLRFTLAQ
ncbi:MAG: cell surface protein SprA [Bacteroidota bacterium]